MVQPSHHRLIRTKLRNGVQEYNSVNSVQQPLVTCCFLMADCSADLPCGHLWLQQVDAVLVATFEQRVEIQIENQKNHLSLASVGRGKAQGATLQLGSQRSRKLLEVSLRTQCESFAPDSPPRPGCKFMTSAASLESTRLPLFTTATLPPLLF